MSKSQKKPKLKPRDIYGIAEECVVNGIESGWNRAHKHVSNPDKDFIFESQKSYVMTFLSERFDWDDVREG